MVRRHGTHKVNAVKSGYMSGGSMFTFQNFPLVIIMILVVMGLLSFFSVIL